MLRRKELKKRGRNAFYRNWKVVIIVCFIYAILVGSSVFSVNEEFDYKSNFHNIVNINNIDNKSNSDIVNEFINGLTGNKPFTNKFVTKATRGVIGTVVNNVSKTGSFLFGILNATNQFLFKDRILPSIIIIIGAILSFIYWVFVSKVLEVGYVRFFLENSHYTKTKISTILMPYKLKKVRHIAYTMFLKNLYTILWSFTLIGGVIKYYSYKMVPYILAENPNMPAKDVLRLSREMMDGYKWEMFKLDFSFIGYQLLGLLTFKISDIIFTRGYINATYAEVYLYLRDLAKTKGSFKAECLTDDLLDGEIVLGEYPVYNKILKNNKIKKLFSLNYDRKYKVTDLIFIFFCISLLGFMWETIYHLFRYGVLVKRGTLHGPWLPIYGGGVIALLVLLKNYRKNPFIYFLLSMLVCGIIEYCTSLYLETVHHLSWWSYEGFFLNINGRVCLEALITFGIGGVVATYIIAPIIANFLSKVSNKFKITACLILVSLMVFDFCISSFNPNTGSGVTKEVKEVVNSP